MEPTSTSSSNRAKILLISAGIVLASAGITIYGLSAYNNGLWPFPVKKTGDTTQENTKTVVEGKLDTEPVVREISGNEVLNVRPAIQATTQGDCTLTISGNGNEYVYNNTSKGADGILGCLEFFVDASMIEAGTYDMKIEFTSESETSTVNETLIVK